MIVEKGFNSDVTAMGMQYHVQTEDWGFEKSCIVTRVYRNGAVVKSFKLSYATILEDGPTAFDQALRLAMRDQHQKILDQLLAGQF